MNETINPNDVINVKFKEIEKALEERIINEDDIPEFDRAVIDALAKFRMRLWYRLQSTTFNDMGGYGINDLKVDEVIVDSAKYKGKLFDEVVNVYMELPNGKRYWIRLGIMPDTYLDRKTFERVEREKARIRRKNWYRLVRALRKYAVDLKERYMKYLKWMNAISNVVDEWMEEELFEFEEVKEDEEDEWF